MEISGKGQTLADKIVIQDIIPSCITDLPVACDLKTGTDVNSKSLCYEFRIGLIDVVIKI